MWKVIVALHMIAGCTYISLIEHGNQGYLSKTVELLDFLRLEEKGAGGVRGVGY